MSSILEDFGPSTEAVVKTVEEIRKEKYSLQTLQIEYTRLFINGAPSVLAPPYASAYSEERWFYGPPAIRALHTYQKAGLAFSPKSREMPDYLLVELEFMIHLCQNEMKVGKSYGEASDIREEQHCFLTEQLMPWVSVWRGYVETSDRAGFYAKLAALINEWLKTDAVYLENTGERSIA
ncbi:MAG: molecular chaperone TorD family protein [Nitrospirota bacterium]